MVIEKMRRQMKSNFKINLGDEMKAARVG